MSYDLFVWHGPAATTFDEASALLTAAAEGDPEDLTPSPRMAAFLAALFAEYPNLHADDPHPAWACTDDTSDRHAILSLTATNDSDAVFARIVSLSRKHGLHCFDPQQGDFPGRRP